MCIRSPILDSTCSTASRRWDWTAVLPIQNSYMHGTMNLDDYSVPALRVELQRRGLATNGLKSALRARLQHALESTGGAITVPTRFQVALTVAEPECERESLAVSGKRPRVAKAKNIEVTAVGVWMGRSVWVTGVEDMNELWTIGDAYGKGNLSRSAPDYAHDVELSLTKGKAARNLAALEKTEAEETGHEATREGVEHLQLTLIEAFHAAFHARRMKLVTRKGKTMDDEKEVWKLFNNKYPEFAERFAAYAKYRATGWMPRSGLKYGVDWVLYRVGQRRHTHAQYCVVLSCSTNRERVRLDDKWIRLQNKLRLVKNVSKSLIVTDVRFENGPMPSTWQEAIAKVQITEVTVDRWVA